MEYDVGVLILSLTVIQKGNCTAKYGHSFRAKHFLLPAEAYCGPTFSEVQSGFACIFRGGRLWRIFSYRTVICVVTQRLGGLRDDTKNGSDLWIVHEMQQVKFALHLGVDALTGNATEKLAGFYPTSYSSKTFYIINENCNKQFKKYGNACDVFVKDLTVSCLIRFTWN